LSQIFPSGWEIMNDRMSALPVTGTSAMDYQDIRDDRVFTYFDLWGGGDVQRMYKVQLNAAYAGRYYLPTVACEGMYDSRVRASVPGKWVEVI
jgi:alpha-2-macroglobulin